MRIEIKGTESVKDRHNIQNWFDCLIWIFKVSAPIFNKQNQNRPIRTGDTACQSYETSLR